MFSSPFLFLFLYTNCVVSILVIIPLVGLYRNIMVCKDIEEVKENTRLTLMYNFLYSMALYLLYYTPLTVDLDILFRCSYFSSTPFWFLLGIYPVTCKWVVLTTGVSYFVMEFESDAFRTKLHMYLISVFLAYYALILLAYISAYAYRDFPIYNFY